MLDKEEFLKLLQMQRLEETGCTIIPYTNRDGTESWQQTLDKLVCDPEVADISIVAANSTGKTAAMAYLVLTILNGYHPLLMSRFNRNTGITTLFYSPSFPVQEDAIQAKLAEFSNWECSVESDSDRYKIYKNGSLMKSIRNTKLKNLVKFRTADSGATGNVGAEPEIIIADEPLPEKVKKELVARMRKKGCLFIQACTALDLKHVWVIEEAQKRLKEPDKRFPLLQAKTEDNPNISLEVLERWKREYGEESSEYRVRALGSLETLNGLVFPQINDCIIENDYPISEEEEGRFLWIQADDYGTSDPCLFTFTKAYASGLKVIEDEVYIRNEKDPDEWATRIHQKREEWDFPVDFVDVYRKTTDVDIKSGCIIRRPHFYRGDGAYLQRTFRGPTLRKIFGDRKLYPAPSKKQPLEMMLPIIWAEMESGRLKIRRRCKSLIKCLQNHMKKVNDQGKVSYDMPAYDHGADNLHYLYQAIPGSASWYYENKQWEDSQKSNTFLQFQTQKKKQGFH